MSDLPEIGYGTVHGRYVAGLTDSEDPEEAPDAEPMVGHVEFWPTATVVLVGSAAPVPTTLMPQTVCAPLDSEGYLANQDTGERGLALFATDDPDGNPVNWQWRAVFHLSYRGKAVKRSPFNFALPAGSVVDLTTVSPVTDPSTGEPVVVGPPGPPGPPGGPGPAGAPGAPGGGTQQAIWNWLAAPVAGDVPTARVGVDTDAPLDATIVRLNKFGDTSGIDWSPVIASLKAGDHLYIQQKTDSAVFIQYLIHDVPTLSVSGTTWSIPVEVEPGGAQGSEPGQSTDVLVAFQFQPPPGPEGPPGPAPEMQAGATAIQWRVEGETTWNDLLPIAGLNVAGWARAVYIPKGGTVPGGLPVYTLIIEAEV